MFYEKPHLKVQMKTTFIRYIVCLKKIMIFYSGYYLTLFLISENTSLQGNMVGIWCKNYLIQVMNDLRTIFTGLAAGIFFSDNKNAYDVDK